MTPALDGRDADFVREFLVDGNASAACRRAGIPPSQAKRMLNNPDIQRAIAARTAAGDQTPADAVSVDGLIADARRAQRAAEDAGNVAGMVAATQLIARLSGKADGEAEPEPAESIDSRNLARTLIQLCKTPEELQLLRAVLLVLSEKRLVATATPGEVLLRVPPELADTVGYPPAVEIAPARGPEPAASEKFEVGETEVFDNGSSITLTEINTGGGLRPIVKWAVRSAVGELHGYRRTRQDAEALAKSLPAHPGVTNE